MSRPRVTMSLRGASTSSTATAPPSQQPSTHASRTLRRPSRGLLVCLLSVACAVAVSLLIWQRILWSSRVNGRHPAPWKQTMLEMSFAVGRAERVLRHTSPRTASVAAGRDGGSGETVLTADRLANAAFAKLASPVRAVVTEESVASGLVHGGSSTDAIIFADPLDASREFAEGLVEFASTSACLTVCGRPVAAITSFPLGPSPVTVVSLPDGRTLEFVDAAAARDALRSLPDASFFDAAVPARCSASPCTSRRRGPMNPHAAALSDRGGVRGIDIWGVKSALRLILTRSQLRNHSREDGHRTLAELVDVLRDRTGGTMSITRAGGSSYKARAVATGDADAYVHEGALRPWDTCAAELTLRSAGGVFSGYLGEEISYCIPESWRTAGSTETRAALGKEVWGGSGVLAAAPQLHASLLSLVRRGE